MNKVIAVILAGGRSSRMGILCHQRPKPLLPFGGKYHVIDFTLSNCFNSDFKDVLMITADKEIQIADYIKKWQSFNTNCIDISVIKSNNNHYSGTADAVRQNIKYIKQYNPDEVLLLAADHVYNMDYRKMLEFHRRSKSDVTIGVTRVPIMSANRFGIVYLDEQKRVVNFIEKPPVPDNNLISMGIYIFNTETLINSLEDDARITDSIHDFGYSIMPRLIREKYVSGYEYSGYWRDIGTPQAYLNTNFEFIEDVINTADRYFPPLLTASEYKDGSNTIGYDNVTNSFIARGCVIKGRVDNSILYPGVWIEKHAIVKNSIIMPNGLVGYHSVIENSILDEGVHVSRYSYVGLKDGHASEDTGITILGKDSLVPPYTVVSRNSRIPPYSLIEHSYADTTLSNASVNLNNVPVSNLLSLFSYI
jgi:glucose-1-phosphate adenylyltransferase